MTKLYTIGFTKKTAKQFFELLENNKISKLVDIRANNTSQLAGFAKGSDLEYFVNKILQIPYFHNVDFAPTKELLSDYQNKKIDWNEYMKTFNMILDKRNITSKYNVENFDGACFLCSEDVAVQCHRRLVVEYLKKNNPEIQIIHLK